ncbi:RNA-binding protein involved in heterochromatin assembly dri1-like [Typha angustifolia]|uniref:RNA-binding protein involved in heterochromatin assembly dri1-like n=1 Tax=Typha angustifolia TaxID=59011 RepID=UPI003C2BF90B
MSSRKPGDWNCRSCEYLNFCKRESCQRCGEAKLGVERRSEYGSISGGGWDVKPGDWYCSCGVHNYASRPNCFKCSATKNDSAVTQSWGFHLSGHPTAGWKSGDWICSSLECNEHNFASRTECFRCNAPRRYG